MTLQEQSSSLAVRFPGEAEVAEYDYACMFNMPLSDAFLVVLYYLVVNYFLVVLYCLFFITKHLYHFTEHLRPIVTQLSVSTPSYKPLPMLWCLLYALKVLQT